MFLLCYNPISYNIFCKKQSITYRLLFCPSTILIPLSVAAIIFYIASKSEIAAEIFSIMAGDSFDTFSTRQDLSTIPICGVVQQNLLKVLYQIFLEKYYLIGKTKINPPYFTTCHSLQPPT